ncbi:hypothetical protein A33Q_2301 [Indibacter alkaliphilus LW1]|uniref:Uncharacterized protein n=1 Tax=Indibacter alkaliphilus (strain CCUG 57479 / KCTC 22604 / LW1) TaxID=1189612 RepID=S2DWS4_INDAL|nr:hypothetical protein A33Q_2301 [Indibacter alkaliphilus LW1]
MGKWIFDGAIDKNKFRVSASLHEAIYCFEPVLSAKFKSKFYL